MPKDEPRTSETFSVPLDRSTNLSALILSQIVEMRADLDALIVITIEGLASLTGQDAREIASRHESVRQDFVLKHAFRLQDKPPESPEKQS
jgi:hypothetical protein